ncbi:MAG: hypothetical protein K8S55_03645 [Phycisphaerae bacterium]|nr:hypothetical protein [Phycisphaerae bacterium]
MTANPLYEKYGKPGSPITCSRYVRAYCPVCGEPVRVSIALFKKCAIQPCFGCDGHCRPGGYAGPTEDCNPSQSNAIRCMEGD